MSERPSGTQRRNRECVVFLDENMSSLDTAAALRELMGWTVELHLDHLPRGASDVDVVTFCGERGWAVITSDEMRYTPETKIAITRHHTRIFKVIGHRDTHGREIIAALVLARRKIIEILIKNKTALCAHVRQNGDVKIMTRFEEAFGTVQEMSESQLRTLRKYGMI